MAFSIKGLFPFFCGSWLFNRSHRSLIAERLHYSPLTGPIPIQGDNLYDVPPLEIFGGGATEHFPDPHHHSVKFLPDLVFPEPEHGPPRFLESQRLTTVPLHVLDQLPGPESVASSRSHVVARASVPEASIDKDGDSNPRKRQVWSAAGCIDPKAISETLSPQAATQS
jgi:hypothetical protein